MGIDFFTRIKWVKINSVFFHLKISLVFNILYLNTLCADLCYSSIYALGLISYLLYPTTK